MTKKRITLEEEIAQARKLYDNMTQEEKIAYSENLFNIERRYAGSHKATTWKRRYNNSSKK